MKYVTEEKIIQIIKTMGVFQVNPLAYRNEKILKKLKKMQKSGILQRQRVSASVVNYILKGENYE